MKKIIAMGAAVALAASMFAAEPAANPQVLEFNGNASVEWGVDLDAGKTGFKNAQEASIKAKLFDGGDKATSGSGVWAELKIVADTKDNEYKNEADGSVNIKAPKVDTAKIHINNFYVGIQKGDTETGEFKPQAAIVSDKAWLGNVGPAGFTQGLVFGYDDSNINAGVDFRSFEHTSTQYTNAYAIAAEATMKDANEWVEGLEVKGGVSYNLSKNYYEKADNNLAVKKFALKHDINSVEGSILGYSGSVAYKVALDDKYYIKPMVGIVGDVLSAEVGPYDYSASANEFVASVLFGWGAQADANAGVPFLDDGDDAKKVTPGVSVVFTMPLPTKETMDSKDKSTYVRDIAKIVPSIYSGDIFDGLKFGAYSEIILMRDEVEVGSGYIKDACANKDRATAIAIAAGASYDVKAGDVTITTKAGARYANKAYKENNFIDKKEGKEVGLFKDLGYAKDDEGYLNLKIGADINGLLDNTTFFVNYTSANLLNETDYDVDYYAVKAGTLNVGAKIHF
ncbi:MAG: hypothetical protein SPH83_09995 [Treponema sp.]|nr:hypothetical protein [Spirochaetales bacterium]MDY6190813.1 hypothetical protein [Treponema sp.]